MSVGATPSALRRKLGASRAPAAVHAMTPDRAWRLALVHGLSETAGLQVTLDKYRATSIDPPGMAEQMETGDLAVLLEGPVGFGVAVLDVQLMAALIESQTMGRVLARPAQARTPTPTDAAMVADPLDRALALFETHGKGVDGAETCCGMRYATQLTEARAVAMSLPDRAHLLTEITLKLGGTDRLGRLRVILPRELPARDVPTPGAQAWAADLDRNLASAQAQLSAVLVRIHLPIEAVTDFKVGQLVAIPAKSLGHVALTSCTGTVLAQGRLGQKAGHKAVLLDSLPDPVAPPVPLAAPSDPGAFKRR